VRRLQRRRRAVVFTNGCFDLLHAGHVALLEKARGLGDFLIVGVNTDRSVRRLKGAGRFRSGCFATAETAARGTASSTAS